MTRVECPQCGAETEAEPGSTVDCRACGFSAPFDTAGSPPADVPPAPPSPDAADRPPAHVEDPKEKTPGVPDVETARQESPANQPAPWAYLFGVIGVLTFWLAGYLLPFLFGVAAIVLGIVGRVRDPKERRSVPAIVLGALAVAAGGITLAV